MLIEVLGSSAYDQKQISSIRFLCFKVRRFSECFSFFVVYHVISVNATSKESESFKGREGPRSFHAQQCNAIKTAYKSGRRENRILVIIKRTIVS